MHNYRISKYRNSKSGSFFLAQEWTAFSDVGKIFNGHELSMTEYLQAEEKYISCVSDILCCCKIKNLWITYLESNHQKTAWKTGMLLFEEDIHSFIRDCLREKCWGILETCSFRIEFGFDFYIHISCRLSLASVQSIANKYSLTVEKWGKIQSGIRLQITQVLLRVQEGICNLWDELKNIKQTRSP